MDFIKRKIVILSRLFARSTMALIGSLEQPPMPSSRGCSLCEVLEGYERLFLRVF